MAFDAATGMAYLHHRSILHRDLKSPNLLVDDSWRCKVRGRVDTGRRQAPCCVSAPLHCRHLHSLEIILYTFCYSSSLLRDCLSFACLHTLCCPFSFLSHLSGVPHQALTKSLPLHWPQRILKQVSNFNLAKILEHTCCSHQKIRP